MTDKQGKQKIYSNSSYMTGLHYEPVSIVIKNLAKDVPNPGDSAADDNAEQDFSKESMEEEGVLFNLPRDWARAIYQFHQGDDDAASRSSSQSSFSAGLKLLNEEVPDWTTYQNDPARYERELRPDIQLSTYSGIMNPCHVAQSADHDFEPLQKDSQGVVWFWDLVQSLKLRILLKGLWVNDDIVQPSQSPLCLLELEKQDNTRKDLWGMIALQSKDGGFSHIITVSLGVQLALQTLPMRALVGILPPEKLMPNTTGLYAKVCYASQWFFGLNLAAQLYQVSELSGWNKVTPFNQWLKEGRIFYNLEAMWRFSQNQCDWFWVTLGAILTLVSLCINIVGVPLGLRVASILLISFCYNPRQIMIGLSVFANIWLVLFEQVLIVLSVPLCAVSHCLIVPFLLLRYNASCFSEKWRDLLLTLAESMVLTYTASLFFSSNSVYIWGGLATLLIGNTLVASLMMAAIASMKIITIFARLSMPGVSTIRGIMPAARRYAKPQVGCELIGHESRNDKHPAPLCQ